MNRPTLIFPPRASRVQTTTEQPARTVAIILRQNAYYHFRGQEARAQHRYHGTVIADASIDNAASMIADGLADIYISGAPRRSVEHLDPRHPLSINQIALRRRAEQEFLMRSHQQ